MNSGKRFFNEAIETMERGDLDALVDERIRYTVNYAYEHSPFYKKWFREHGIQPADVRTHEDLQELPIISGQTIREHQPLETAEFEFRSRDWPEIFTLHETSGTSGTPKAFFLSWEDWQRYAEKYARSFVSQGFGPGDRVVVCASYGMNVGANTMTLAAQKIGMTIIPEGKCTFPVRILKSYQPTGLVGSVFKLLRLARRMTLEQLPPQDSSVKRLVVGGESFADESRAYLAELWGCDVYNTYGSTEGTMCGECTALKGLHVPEDLVHLDVYDPHFGGFVPEGECGRIVLHTPPGGREVRHAPPQLRYRGHDRGAHTRPVPLWENACKGTEPAARGRDLLGRRDAVQPCGRRTRRLPAREHGVPHGRVRSVPLRR